MANVLIPMAGEGSRFYKAGYNIIKPLIPVKDDLTMIEVVIHNIGLDHNYTFVAKKDHDDLFYLKNFLKSILPNCNVVLLNHLKMGAAYDTLYAEDYFDGDDNLFIANSDQYVESFSIHEMLRLSEDENLDGCISVFRDTDPKWSFARVGADGLVVEVAEKNPISDIATVGFYFWKKAKDYFDSARDMIIKGVKTNDEFYICPTYNELIIKGKRIGIQHIKKMWGLGTPEDLRKFQKLYDYKIPEKRKS